MQFLSELDGTTIISTLVAALIGYKTASMQSKNTKQTDDRKLLSEDEKAFRADLMEQFRLSREQMGLLQTQNDELAISNIDLRKKIIQLQAQNDKMIIEIQELREQNRKLLERNNRIEEENTLLLGMVEKDGEE